MRAPEVRSLRAEDAGALLAFERVNRAYFAGFISDRGDEYFAEFDALLRAVLADQDAGVGAYYLLLAEDATIIGRVNLTFGEPGTAVLGYRVAQSASGRGVATAAVRTVCELAAREHGIRRIRAATSTANVASRRVLTKAGFVPVGPAGPTDLGGKTGTWFERGLSTIAARGR